MSRAGLNDLLTETKLGILRCVCGGCESLPAHSLQAMALTSPEWYALSSSPEVLPFFACLESKLLTENMSCKRAGDAWPPTPPLTAHRRQDSEPLGDRDFLTHFYHVCLRRGFEPAYRLQERFAQPIDVATYVRELTSFREQHFSLESANSSEADVDIGSPPAPVWCAASCVLPGRRVCVAGGGCYSFELANAQTDLVEVFHWQPDIHVFDVDAKRWARQAVTGNAPPAAHVYATAHALLGSRWLFWCGGYYGQSYNSAYSLDVNDWEWRALRNSSAETPSARYFSASFQYLGALFSWGGRGEENQYFSDLWRLDPSRVQDNVVHSEEVRVSGELPPAKFGATLTNCDDRFAILFGGGQWKRGGHFNLDTDIFLLELESFAWMRLSLSGPQPAPRCQHSAVNLGGDCVLVLGGYDGNKRRYLGIDDVALLNVRSLRWMRVHKENVIELRVGLRVAVIGLQTRPELNGIEGKLIRWEPSRERWLVKLDNGLGEKSINPRNLRVLQPQPVRSDDEDEEDETDEEENHPRPPPDLYAPRMLSPFFEKASSKSTWIRGDFPSARAGMAVADGSQQNRQSRSFYIFGGAQYVHQDWYNDLYECSLRHGTCDSAGE
eukprot:TRINITY_DN64527_c0_g1_i1.p1 TRINITY_DN64527_c0_g1~~TRINITY_DN64527_c0_g1_i1.p1  ORF type:complete len:610 (-),score=68.30 TRINITY_DN64527_c0_g1_i1:17-1846(-)